MAFAGWPLEGINVNEPVRTIIVTASALRVVARKDKKGMQSGPGERSTRGFTLIELLIVITIVAILAAVAVPSYYEYIKRSYRSEAQAYLMTIAARQQQFLLDTRSFSMASPDSIVSQPRNVATAYTVTMTTESGPPPTFMLTATPTAAQASERCGTLTLDQTGTKTAAVAGCW